MTQDSAKQCSDAQMREVLDVAAVDTAAGIAAIDVALSSYPDDARLHFLKGSMLIGEKRFIAAHAALSNAVKLAPEFHLARFQLGFFELTSGEAETARETWQPLHTLPPDSYLRVFVDGLDHLIGDRFETCIETLRRGMTLNTDNQPLNNDMQMIIERCEEILAGGKEVGGIEDEAVSATSFLLGTSRRSKQ